MAKGDPQFSEQELPPDTQMLDRQDLMDMLERARELAKSGAKDAAREMLSQLRDMLENLRADPFAQQMNQDMQEARSEEHTSELQSLMRISYAVFCLKKKNNQKNHITSH